MTRFRSLLLPATMGALVLGACAGGGTPTGNNNNNNGGGGGGTPTLSSDVQPIFSSNCAVSGCHTGVTPEEGQNLSPGLAWSNTVGVPSNQSPLQRIRAGEPDSSYLVHKIQGTHLSVGGSGDQMPQGRSPLSQGNIDTIREWITAGALNN